MNYQAHLDTEQTLELSNHDGHTSVALSSDENGHSQAQNSAFATGQWSQKPQLFGIGVGFVIQFETDQGRKWVSIDQNGIHLLDKSPDLNDAKPLDLAESEAASKPSLKPMEPMQPMSPMKPMGS